MRNNNFIKEVSVQLREIRRYLTLITLLFTLALGNAWAADPTIASGEIPSAALDISDFAKTVKSGSIDKYKVIPSASGTTTSGDPYYVLVSDSLRQEYASKASNLPWVYCKATDGGGSHTLSYADGLTDADKLGFVSATRSVGINSGRYHNYRVKNCTSITLLNRSNNTSNEKRIWLNVFKYNSLTESFEYQEQIKSAYNSSKDIVVSATLNASDEYVVQITSGSTSNSKAVQIRFIGVPAATCTSNPSNPGGLAASSITAEGATFTITDEASTNNYELYWNTTGTAPESTTTASATSTSKTKAVTGLIGGTTYYAWVRSVCDASHKSGWVALGTTSFTTLAEPTATFSNSTYDINGGSPLDLTTLWSSNSEGAVTYTIEEVNGTGATISTAAFTATTAGTAKVKAVQAANGNYTEITKYAYITVGSNAVGEHTITYNVATGTSQTTLATASKVSTSLRINNLSDIALYGEGMSVQSGGGKTNSTPKIPTPSSEDANKYTYLTFAVQEGYEFTISQISTKLVAVSTDKTVKLEISDNNGGTTQSLSYTHTTDSDPGTGHDFEFTTNNTYSGTVTIKLFVWGDDKTYRLGKPLTITGTLVAAGACTPPTISWNGDQPTGALMGEGSKTFKVNTNYSDGVTLELSDNTCYATIAAIAGKDNKEWSLSYTTAGSVKVTAKVVGDGTTVCAEAVTDATVKTFTVTPSHTVTYNMKGHGTSIAAKLVAAGAVMSAPNEPSEIGYIFGGWYKEDGLENAWDFANDLVNADVELFAKWTEFAGCTELWPATSGEAPTAANEVINLQSGSKGGSIFTVSAKSDKFNESFEYTTSGFALKKGSDDVIGVSLNNEIAVGTKISVTLYSNNTGARGLVLNTATGGKVGSEGVTLGWSDATVGAVETFTYTAEAGDGLVGTNGFRLKRNNTVYLQCVRVESCGSAIVYHDLTSVVDPVGKGTVTLGASSVREGYTTTATYSDIDAAYDFDEWQISGTGASIEDASANPAVITMGTGDAVVTLKLKAATPKHTVSYNVMGHGVAPSDELVKEGAKVTKPTDPSADNWAFCGWYKENTLEHEWNFDVDVMGTENITLYAKWEDETGAIKLFSNTGVLNTTNFVSPAKTTIEINEVEYTCLTQFASNRTSLGGAVPADFVQYNATTNAAKMKITLYNTNSGEKSALLYMVEEGDTEFTPVEIKVPGQTIFTTSYYTFNSSKNRSFYLCAKDRSNIRVLQVTVLDNGTVIQQAGQAGYSMNFNKGRMYVSTSAATSFEGATINVSSEYKVANNSSLATNSNISFTTTVDKMLLRVTRAGGNYYVSQDPENKGTSYNTNQEIELSPAGTWYLGSISSGSAASFSKIEFVAPKCETPAFNALANSEICSGDPYVALDGTGTVSDGGSITYKWYAHGADESDPAAILATTATYTPTADGTYYVKALHHVDGYTDNEATSDEVTVTTYASAQITTAPTDVRQEVGQVATLNVVATGKAPLSYQWYTCDDAEGNNPVIITGAEEDSYSVTVTANMDQYYKVVVSSGCGEASAVAKIVEWVELPQLSVSTTTTWDWVDAGENIKLTSETTPAKDEECVMANVKVGGKMPTNDATFNSQALLFSGENVRAKDGGRYYASLGHIKFNAAVSGKVTVEFSDNGTNDRRLKINEALSESSSSKTDIKTFSAIVPAGEVTLMGVNNDGSGSDRYIRISKIIFSTTDVDGADYTRDLTQGRYGTICLPNGGVMVGADLFEIAYYGETSQKIFFDQIMNGVMEAGVPYVFLPREGASQLGVYYTDSENAPAGSRNGLIGSYTQEIVTPNDGNYILLNNQYCFVNSTAYVGANRAYIKLSNINPTEPALAPGRIRMSMGVVGAPQVATGCENIEASDKPTKVMINGQLFIIRGEKTFDATGRLVK